jgi:hypothetical protein
MITTASKSAWPDDVPVTDLPMSGLNHASFVRMKFFTLPVKQIDRSIGILSGADIAAVKKAIKHHLAEALAA